MDPVTFFVVLLILYGVALFFDLFFKSCMHYPYDAFLRNTGITVQLLRLRWHTTALNRTIFKWGSSCSKFFIHAFNLGIAVALILMVAGVFLLLVTLFQSDDKTLAGKTGTKQFDVQLELMLPGVNLPLDEIGYYSLALLICSVIHELGHALAAVMEDVPVCGFGLHILFCFPVAYTELSTDHMNVLKPIRKLRIYCAGIWHNVLLAATCYIIFSSLGVALGPFYHTGNSVVVSEISANSPFLDAKGIFTNDILLSINDCKVHNSDTWYKCLLKSIRVKPAYCVSSDFIRLNDESGLTAHIYDGVIQCCDPKNTKVACFEYVNDMNNDDPIEIPQHVCLDIRKTIEDSSSICTNACEEGFCIKPLLNNSTTILTIARKGKPDVLYIGHPADLYHTTKISEFVPKTKYFNPQLADSISLFLKYNIVFSFGLAVINAVPCFSLDGYHISSTIINTFLVSKVERGKRELIVILISCVGTLLFLSSVLKVLLNSLFTKIF